MRRRTLLLGTLAAGALAGTQAFAQLPGRQYRVGVILPVSLLGNHPFVAALRERLAAHGFVEGRNLTLDIADGGWYRSVALKRAQELIALKPDALFTLSSIVTLATAAETRTIPIVFAWVSDPVYLGIVKAYREPGGNATGVSNRFFELTSKRLELVRELVPGAKRVAAIAGVFDEALQTAFKLAQPTADRLGLEIARIEAGGDWRGAVRNALRERADAALVTTPFSMFGLKPQQEEAVAQAIQERLPTVYSDDDSVAAGGLASYATNLVEDVRRGADVLARVLKGEPTASLAVDQASRFELALNLKTARAIGFNFPQSVLVRADRVIE